jgi:hypothetical protein
MNDGPLDAELMKAVPPNVLRVVAKNSAVDDDRIVPMPGGRDFRNQDVYHLAGAPQKTPDHRRLLYSNFAINTNQPQRKPVYDLFKDQAWVTTVEVRQWMQYPISREEYVRQVEDHRFCLSPDGNGVDCFRTWEALYLKSIPIVSSSQHMDSFRDLPILFTRDYSEITEEYLDETFAAMLNRHYSMEKLKYSYWERRIRQCLPRPAKRRRFRLWPRKAA